MQVILTIQSDIPGPKRTVLREGQVLRVGRTSWADFSVPGDAEMADVHFSVECRGSKCTLRALQRDSPTQRNDDEVTESVLEDGDSIIAGGTTFLVRIEGAPVSVAEPKAGDEEDTDDELPDDSGFAHVENPSAAEIAAGCELSEEGTALMTDKMIPRQFVDELIAAGNVRDAITFLAYALPKREAVWWGAACAESARKGTAGGREITAIATARKWVTDPSEENRRAAEAIAMADKDGTPAGYASLAAFFSGGSLAPPDLPEVPPDDKLTAQIVAASIPLAAADGDPLTVDERLLAFLKTGIAIADGDNRWEEA